jgi:hypothetical protein
LVGDRTQSRNGVESAVLKRVSAMAAKVPY